MIKFPIYFAGAVFGKIKSHLQGVRERGKKFHVDEEINNENGRANVVAVRRESSEKSSKEGKF